MIKAIAVDLGGVVFAEGKSVACERLKNDFGYEAELLNDILTSPQSIDLRKGLLSDEDFWKWASKQLPTNYDTAIIKKYWYEGYLPDNDIINLLKDLKGTYKLIAFSGNVKSRIDYLEEKYRFRSLFDTEVYSFDYNLIKPEKAFVEAMISAANVAPEQIVYLDDKDKDAFEAKGLGVNVVIYKRGHIKELHEQLAELGIKSS